MTGRGDTIAAFASGHGRAGVAVLRLSGPLSGPVLRGLLRGPTLPDPRRASLRGLHDADGALLDRGLVLWLPGPGSFTGEDVVELHVHGGTAVRAALLRAVTVAGARPAEPGEFTRRAFLNGKLDLTAVEGLGDLIEAETEAQRRQAMRQLDGTLAAAVARWREQLLDALAAAEASLDFPDEDDVPADVAEGVPAAVGAVRSAVAAALAEGRRGEKVRDGFTVVIAGPPNAGKSTLLNALARREVAIVSPIPGTTRDAIEVRCDLDGLPVTFVDTAGLRATADPIEREGVSRASARMASADLILWLEAPDGTEPRPGSEAGSTPLLVIRTKRDVADAGSRDEAGASPPLGVSALTGQGMGELRDAVVAQAGRAFGSGNALLTRERHRVVLEEVQACLERAAEAERRHAPELVAEDLRLALRALGRMTGAVDVEEVLDRVFSSFCIGK